MEINNNHINFINSDKNSLSDEKSHKNNDNIEIDKIKEPIIDKFDQEHDKEEEKELYTVKYYPQDSMSSKAVMAKLKSSHITKGPDNDKIETAKEKIGFKEGTATQAEPDKNNNLIYDQNDKRSISVNVFYCVSRSLDNFEKFSGETVKWPSGNKKLKLYPDNGITKKPSARYDYNKGSINFFNSIDYKTKKTIFAGNSQEIVTHELGHALLDSVRPKYISNKSPENLAFHESFADINAIISDLGDENVVRMLKEETNGDLKKDNLVSKMGEEFAEFKNLKTGDNTKTFIRNANNNYKYTDPENISYNSKENNSVGKEQHEFSQIFTGAFYDITNTIYEKYKKDGNTFEESIKKTHDDISVLMFKGIKKTPEDGIKFKDMIHAMIQADKENFKGKYSETIRNTAIERNIIRPDDKI